MKVHYNYQDKNLAESLAIDMLSSINKNLFISVCSDECDPLFLDYKPDQDNFMNIEMEIRRIGFTEVAKAIFQGSRLYRSDCGKCPRCYRFRPEIAWNNEYLKENYLCNRCHDFISKMSER